MKALAILPKYRAISFRGWPFFVPGWFYLSEEIMALTKADFEILDLFNEMSDIQKEQFTEMTRLVGSRGDGGEILSRLLAQGIGGPDTFEVALEVLRRT